MLTLIEFYLCLEEYISEKPALFYVRRVSEVNRTKKTKLFPREESHTVCVYLFMEVLTT